MSDAPPPPPAPDVPAAEHRFPCESCGADMRFDPGERMLHCDHCGHTEAMAGAGPWDGGLRELDFEAAMRNLLPLQEIETTRVAHCQSCGADIEFDPDTHAAECPFCASPVVTDTGAHRHIKPRGLIPFALSETEAREAMTRWLGALWFAPNGLSAYARKGRRMQGVYVPYWTFDADTRSAYSGQRGTIHYETRMVMRDGKMQPQRVQRIRWRSVRGRVQRWFDDVLVLASRSLPKSHTDALPPWDLSQMEPYKPEYLAGFRAEGYGVDLPDGFAEARQIMDREIAKAVRFDIGGDRQRITRIDTDVSDVTFKHVLLPVWVAAYRYRDRSYRFVVNGQTGRVQGERPYSAWKIALAVLAALVALGIAAVLGGRA